MKTQTDPDAIDTRIVFRVYAIVAWIGGFALLGWGTLWFGVDLPCLAYGLAVPIRITGGIVMGAGCLARALGNVENPEARHKALAWFAWGHTIVLLVVLMQLVGVWGEPAPAGLVAIGVLLASIFILFYFWGTGDAHRTGEWQAFTTLFGPRRPTSTVEQLRSEYEQRIREAASQEERNRLARELHDSIKQQIFVIQTAAATAQARFGADEAGAKQAIEQVRSSAREALIEMEVMLDQLRAAPLENAGLVEALKKQCEALGFRTGARVEFTPGPLPASEALPPGAQQTIFRVAQEALANVARHARASNVRVTLGATETGAAQLEIEDDGAGFDPLQAPRGMGLSNMQERASEAGGTVTVKSQAEGTSVVLSIPARLRPADWGNYRRRVVVWGIPVTIFAVLVVLDAAGARQRENLTVDLPFALLSVVVLIRALVAYRRVRSRRGADLWEESTSHS